MYSLQSALFKLQSYIESENYMGYDPYDLLKSPIFSLPILRSNKKIRFLAQQFGKRFPINLRQILNVPKGYNPVTLGLCIQAYSNLSFVQADKKDEYFKKIDFLINELEGLIPEGFSGACWGYDFYWQARNADIPPYQPTIVATGIITNALFKYYEITKNEKAKNLLLSAAHFVEKDLNISETDHGICFSYSPFDNQKVFNASMKAVRLFSHAFVICKDEKYKSLAKDATDYVMHYQTEDGAWVYSDKLNTRIDNYHTGYVITCLKDYIELTEDQRYQDNLDLGLKFYKENFIGDNGAPKFYHNNLYPIDCTAAAQLILTLLDFNEINNAHKIAEFMINNMFNNDGYFYFRQFKSYLIKTSYMRWSHAWMFAALSQLLKYNN